MKLKGCFWEDRGVGFEKIGNFGRKFNFLDEQQQRHKRPMLKSNTS